MIAGLVCEQDFDLQTTTNCSFAFEAGISGPVRFSEDPKELEKFAKFKNAFDHGFANLERVITVDFNLNDSPSEPEQPQTWNIVFKGETLESVHQLLYHGDNSAKLRLELAVKCFRYDSFDERTTQICTIDAIQFKPDVKEDGQLSHACYTQDIVLGVTYPPPSYRFKDTWRLFIGVDISDYICLTDVLAMPSTTAKTIWMEKKFCDVVVLCDDGTTFPCHRAFLGAQSNVLLEKVGEDFLTEGKSQLKISEMSADGVNALLEFIYYDHVLAPIKSCLIALELLIAADKLNIPVLWSVIVTIVMEKPISWFDIDVALKMFDFVSKCAREESLQVEQKLIQVFAQKSEELSESSLYQDLFCNDVAREMLTVILEAYKA